MLNTFDQLEIFVKYWYLSMALLGIIGNSLMFTVFSAGRSLKKHSFSMYFRAMAVSNLSMNIYFTIYFYEFIIQKSIIDLSQFLCKFGSFFTFMIRPLSSWYLVAANIDRFLTIIFPLKFAFLRKPKFSLQITILILIYNIAFYAHLLFNADFVPDVEETASNNMTNWTTDSVRKICSIQNVERFILADFINTSLLPFTIMLASSISTLVGVSISHKRMKKFVQSENSRKRTQMRDIKFGVSIICLDFMFLVFKIPNLILFLANNYDFFFNFDDFTRAVIAYFVQILLSSYYTIEFFIQLASNSIVREEFLLIFSVNVLKRKATRSHSHIFSLKR